MPCHAIDYWLLHTLRYLPLTSRWFLSLTDLGQGINKQTVLLWPWPLTSGRWLNTVIIIALGVDWPRVGEISFLGVWLWPTKAGWSPPTGLALGDCQLITLNTTCCAEFILGIIKLYLHLLLFFNTEISKVVKIDSQGSQEHRHWTLAISGLLVALRHKEPGQQQSWYWSRLPELFLSQHQKD